MKSFICIFAAAAAVLAGGCFSAGDADREPTGGVLVSLDENYVPAVGSGFHWAVRSEIEGEEDLWELQVVVNGKIVCGSEFGLPTDIYIGYWDMKSAEFFFEDQRLPADAVPVKITFVFPEGSKGQASGFIFAPEGENIFVSRSLLLNEASPAAAVFETNASAKRITNKDTSVEDSNIVIRHSAGDYIPANAVQLFIRKALKPGQIPVGLPETISEEAALQEE